VASKLDGSYNFKDDATWFIKPALAKVQFITIEFDENEATSTPISNIVYASIPFYNNQNISSIEFFNQQVRLNYSTEYFNQTSGFALIEGMTYKILAKVPTLDTSGNIFFTAMSVRDWTFAKSN